MAIDRIQKVKNPTLFDRVIVSAEDSLAEALPWLNHVFGRCERLVKEVNGMRRFTPAWYLGHNEYVGLLPDDVLGNFCFFNIDDPTEIQWARGERNRLTATYSLILWVDMRTVEDDDSRNREAVKEQVLKVLNGGLRLRNGHLSVSTIYERSENVYSGFTTDEVDNQFMMSPYAAFRFEGVVMIDESCY